MEFKGTKGKWHSKVTASGMNKGALAMRIFSENQNTWTDSGVCRLNVDEYSKNIQEEQIEMKANALLISKSPEMLEMLIDIVEQENVSQSAHDAIYELIKQATEL